MQALENISYCRFWGYAVPFLENDDIFRPGTCFEYILDLYFFDHELRILVFDVLEHVEIAVRARVTHHHCGRYGPLGYTVPENFASGFNHSQWFAGIEGDRGMKYSDQKAVARGFGVPAPVFQSWMHCFVYIRNLCAHHSRLWNRELEIRPVLPEGRPEWSSPKSMENTRIFSALHVLQYCGMRIGRDIGLARRLRLLFTAYPRINRNVMGFPEDWEELPIWKQV